MTAEYVAQQTTAWLPGAWTPTDCCPHYDACPACASRDQHRSCWGESMTWRHGPHAVSHHEHAVGQILGYRVYVGLYVYEARYNHHATCGCAQAGHPGAGSVDTYQGRGDRTFFQRRGLPVADVPPAPVPDDGHGTPSLLEGLSA